MLEIADHSCSEQDMDLMSMGEIRRATGGFTGNRHDAEAIHVLNQYRMFRLNCIRTSLSILQSTGLPEYGLVCARLKRLVSVYRKLKRNQIRKINSSMSEMDDIIGFRVICRTYQDAIQLGSRIEKRTGARIKNYLSDVHTTGVGYRAIHAVVRFAQPFRGGTVISRFEIQVRTWHQHRWACWCENFGERAKEGFPNPSPADLRTKKRLLDSSRELERWEERNSKVQQRELMKISNSDIHNAVVAWYGDDGLFGFDPFWTDVGTAFQHLRYLETQVSVNPLILIGVTAQSNIHAFLQETHPKYVGRSNPDPEFRIPE